MFRFVILLALTATVATAMPVCVLNLWGHSSEEDEILRSILKQHESNLAEAAQKGQNTSLLHEITLKKVAREYELADKKDRFIQLLEGCDRLIALIKASNTTELQDLREKLNSPKTTFWSWLPWG